MEVDTATPAPADDGYAEIARGGVVAPRTDVVPLVQNSNFAGTQQPATREHPKPLAEPSHLLVTGLPAGTEANVPVALLFSDLVQKDQAQDDAARSVTASNLIASFHTHFGVRAELDDVRVVTRQPKQAGGTAAPRQTAGSRSRLPTTTGSVILRLHRRATAVDILRQQSGANRRASSPPLLDRSGRRCSVRLLGAPHLDDIERPVHQVWLRSPQFRGRSAEDIWNSLGAGLVPAHDALAAAAPEERLTAEDAGDALADSVARAWDAYDADEEAVGDPVVEPCAAVLLPLMQIRETWKPARGVDTCRLELLDPQVARLLQDLLREAQLRLPFGAQTSGLRTGTWASKSSRKNDTGT